MDIALIRRKVRQQQYDLSLHAHQERQEEQITIEEIETALLTGDIIETYSNDLRGESCLVAGMVGTKPLHAVCGMRDTRLLIVTVYRPQLPVWKNYRIRARRLKSRV